jgi:hypothetical protein
LYLRLLSAPWHENDIPVIFERYFHYSGAADLICNQDFRLIRSCSCACRQTTGTHDFHLVGVDGVSADTT